MFRPPANEADKSARGKSWITSETRGELLRAYWAGIYQRGFDMGYDSAVSPEDEPDRALIIKVLRAEEEKLLRTVFEDLPRLLKVSPSDIIGWLEETGKIRVLCSLLGHPHGGRYSDIFESKDFAFSHWLEDALKRAGLFAYQSVNSVTSLFQSFHNEIAAMVPRLHAINRPDLDEDAQMDLFFIIAEGSIKAPQVVAARDYFYQWILKGIPQALEDYHLRNLAKLKESILRGEQQEALHELVEGIWEWDRQNVEGRRRLASPLATVIAKAYGINAPILSEEKTNRDHEAEYCFAADSKMTGTMRFNLEKPCHITEETPSLFFMVVAHEVAGHAVEDALAHRAQLELWQEFPEEQARLFPPINPRIPFGRAARVLAMSAPVGPKGYYFDLIKDKQESYKAQLNERVAAFIEDQAEEFIVMPLYDLSRYFWEACGYGKRQARSKIKSMVDELQEEIEAVFAEEPEAREVFEYDWHMFCASPQLFSKEFGDKAFEKAVSSLEEVYLCVRHFSWEHPEREETLQPLVSSLWASLQGLRLLRENYSGAFRLKAVREQKRGLKPVANAELLDGPRAAAD